MSRSKRYRSANGLPTLYDALKQLDRGLEQQQGNVQNNGHQPRWRGVGRGLGPQVAAEAQEIIDTNAENLSVLQGRQDNSPAAPPVDSTPPVLTGTNVAQAGGKVSLSWSALPVGATQYDLFVGIAAADTISANGAEINLPSSTTTLVTVGRVAGQTYKWRIRATYSGGTVFSNELTLATAGPS